ncbi:peptidase family M1-domain-containing protein [Amylostereum chailletii]|nr:peptidase family M1-domain-containing protein [Amylostereum chailletii]
MSDPTSQSNFLQIATTHIHFDWTVDYEKQTVSGSATHKLAVKEDGVKEVIFDTSHLAISKAEVEGSETTFTVDERHPVMGSALHVVLPSPPNAGTDISVTVFYSTTEECTALQWLAKEQTQGGTFPFLFSQCQAIHARSLTPVQDTPSLKITYSAKVTSILPVLLSAIRVSPPSDGPPHDGKEIGKDAVTYSYNQPIAIPSYLIAIAGGNLRYRPFDAFEDRTWKSGIWAEPELMESAYWEFSADTARFLAKEEDLVGKYRFGVYDLLVLPPSFPYGGMENACLSFLTPTLLAGDRTLVDVVVHELTHSWFGNGVTHANATHFWLNEGWTNYIERLLQQVLHSPAERGFSYIIGTAQLTRALEEYKDKPKYQRLVIDFEKGEDPDDAYSSVPYEKGANFLLYLEGILGGVDAFMPYARDYVTTFMGRSITTWDWKAHLFSYFEKNGTAAQVAALNKVDWNAWFYGEGMTLPVQPEYDTTLAKPTYELAARWESIREVADPTTLDFSPSDVESFNGNQKVVLLERLATYAPFSSAHLTHLGTLYGLSTTSNGEIRSRFYTLALPHAPAFAEPAAQWVTGLDGSGVIKGRMKFCRPVLRAVAQADGPLARRYFERVKGAFHPIARKLLDKELPPA